MASCDPHLLSIPLELRDIIYSHLRQEVRMYWSKKPYSKYLPEDCEVCLPDAPLLNVLLIHPQLSAEYLRKPLCATIRTWKNRNLTNKYSRYLSGRMLGRTARFPFTWPDLEQALARVSQVDIFFDEASRSYIDIPSSEDGKFTDCCGLGSILKTIVQSAPHLTTLRIATRHSPPLPGDYGYRDVGGHEFTSGYFLPPPPDLCASLPLVQRAEGYHVEQYPQLRNGLTYIAKTACYVYSFTPSDRCFWTRADLVREWKLDVCGEQRFSDAGTPAGTMCWREKRGIKEAAQWFDFRNHSSEPSE